MTRISPGRHKIPLTPSALADTGTPDTLRAHQSITPDVPFRSGPFSIERAEKRAAMQNCEGCGGGEGGSCQAQVSCGGRRIERASGYLVLAGCRNKVR